MTVPEPSTASAKYVVKRAAIVAAATEVLNAQGTRGFTLAAVARRMDMHPVSLIYYFKTRQDLAAECLLSTIGRFSVLVEKAARARTVEQRVRAMFAGYFEVRRAIVTGRQAQLASFSEMRQIEAVPDAPVRVAFRILMRSIQELFDPADSLAHRALLTRQMIEYMGWSRAWIDLYPPSQFQQISRSMADICLTGLAAPGQTWPEPAPVPLGADPAEATPRERFLVVATELINLQGYDGASIDQISASLNLTKGAFYHHHTDKEELLTACFDRTLRILDEAQTSAVGANGWQRLCSATVSLAAFQHGGVRGRLLRNYALAALPPKLRPVMIGRYRTAAAGFASLIEAGIADGSIRSVNPMLAAHMVIGVVNSACYLRTWVRDGDTMDIAETYVRPGLMGALPAA